MAADNAVDAALPTLSIGHGPALQLKLTEGMVGQGTSQRRCENALERPSLLD